MLSLLNLFPTLLHAVNIADIENCQPVDVTTDEGIEKVRNAINNILNSDNSFIQMMVDDDMRKCLTNILEDAEAKYADAHKSPEPPVQPQKRLNNEQFERLNAITKRYMDEVILPNSQVIDDKVIQGVHDSLLDFAAWVLLEG